MELDQRKREGENLELGGKGGALDTTLELKDHAWVELYCNNSLSDLKELKGEVTRARTNFQDHICTFEAGFLHDALHHQWVLENVLPLSLLKLDTTHPSCMPLCRWHPRLLRLPTSHRYTLFCSHKYKQCRGEPIKISGFQGKGEMQRPKGAYPMAESDTRSSLQRGILQQAFA